MEITKWMEKVITCLKRGKPLAGRGIIVEETPLGSRIHSKAESVEGGGTTAYRIYIDEFIDGDYYLATKYNLGDDPETDEGVPCVAKTFVSIETDELPAGIELIGYLSSESMVVEETTFSVYIVEFPRWLDEEEEE